MAQERRPHQPGRRPQRGGGGGRAGSSSGRPAGARKPQAQDGKETRGGREAGRGKQPGRPRRDDRAGREGPRSEEQARYDGPPLDESITGAELDRSVRQQLGSLPERLAIRVARHLVAAGQLIDEDPKTAYQHTLAARARAPRVAVVREACGEAAYAAEEYAEALAELRAARRMNGSSDYLPVMADCERALRRPEKALALAKSPPVANLPPYLRAEMTIVEAGARRDMGDLDAAVRTLENAPLQSRSRDPWLVRLRYAYADTLLAADRREEAVEWFHRTVAVDAEALTDAAERVAEIEGASRDGSDDL